MWLVIMIIHNKARFLCCSKLLEKFYSFLVTRIKKRGILSNETKQREGVVKMKNIISIILGILMFLKLMELLYGAIFLDKPLNPITKIIFILTLIYIFYVLVKELIIFLKSKYNKSA